MIEVEIPGRGRLVIEHLVLDVNGTIACDGALEDGVAGRLADISRYVTVTAITADTHGTAAVLRDQTGISVHTIEGGHEAEQKLAFVRSLDAGQVAAVGNGANDVAMLREAAIGVCVVGREGACTAAIAAADVAVTSIGDALDLLLRPARLVATLRA